MLRSIRGVLFVQNKHLQMALKVNDEVPIKGKGRGAALVLGGWFQAAAAARVREDANGLRHHIG